MKNRYKYKFGTYSSEHMFNEIQKKYGDNYPHWRVHSWKVNEGDGSLTVLWEKAEQENTDNGKSEYSLPHRTLDG